MKFTIKETAILIVMALEFEERYEDDPEVLPYLKSILNKLMQED